MNNESSGILAALARAWRSVAKAFAREPDVRASQQYGADTTLFGASTELPRDRASRDRVRDEFWVPTETTDYADLDNDRDGRR